MPIIPDASQLDRSVPQSRRGVVIDRSDEILASGVVDAQRAYDERQEGIAIGEASKATGELQRDAAELERASALSDNPMATEDALLKFDERVENLARTLSPRAARHFRESAVPHRQRLAIRADAAAAAKKALKAESSAGSVIDTGIATVAMNPDDWEEVATNSVLSVSTAQIMPETRQRLMNQVGDIGKAARTAYIERTPRQVLQYLSGKAELSPTMERLFGNMPPDERARVEKLARGTLIDKATSSISREFEKGRSAGEKALAALSQVGLDDEAQFEIRAAVNARRNLIHSERQSAVAEELTELERRIDAGSATQAEMRQVDALLEAMALTPSEHASLLTRFDRGRRQAAENSAAAATVAQTIAAGLPLDPSNAGHRKTLDSAFAADTAGAKAGDSVWTSTALAYASKARMLPPSASGWLRQAARSPDAKLAARAAQFYGAMEVQAPEAVGEVDTDTRAFLGSLSSMIEAGAAPEKAFETARANTFDVAAGVMERRRTAWTALSKQTDAALAQHIGKDFDAGLFRTDPAAGAGAQVAYQQQVRQYFLASGDVETAKKLAWQDIKRVYGPTSVNGKAQLQPFPIERYGLTPEDVRGSIEQFLAANPQDPPVTAADVVVLADRMTTRAVADALTGTPVRPTYALVMPDGSPLFTAAGVPARFALPDTEELQQLIEKRRSDAQAAELEKARGIRERREMLQDSPTRFTLPSF